MAENKPVKLTAFPESAVSPTRKPLYGSPGAVDQYGNQWVRISGGQVGAAPETTGVDNTVDGTPQAGIDPGGLIRLIRVDSEGDLNDASAAKLDDILTALNKILFVLSVGLDVEAEDSLQFAVA